MPGLPDLARIGLGMAEIPDPTSLTPLTPRERMLLTFGRYVGVSATVDLFDATAASASVVSLRSELSTIATEAADDFSAALAEVARTNAARMVTA